MANAHKTEVKIVSHDNAAAIASGIVNGEKRKRGRPRAIVGVETKPGTSSEPKTKIINGKLMKKSVGKPKKLKTGKPGRPRKQYIWVEAK